MKITELIPQGKNNAISRSHLLTLCKEYGIANTDREMRRQIAKAREEFAILNTQTGQGYFRPGKDDKEELRHYIMQEAQRSITILQNLEMAKNLLSDMEKNRI